MARNGQNLTAEKLDALHDSGANMTAYWDEATSRRPALETQRVNVDLPRWMISSLDRKAERLGVTRQAVIKSWIADHPEGSANKAG